MAELRLSGGALDGLALHYVSAGRGPAVVLLHGLGGFAESWRRTVEALAPRYTVIAVDLPGFGRSAKPRARYSLGFFANALGGFLDGLGLGSVSLVGHSLGGAVAVAFSLTRPTRVERLAWGASARRRRRRRRPASGRPGRPTPAPAHRGSRRGRWRRSRGCNAPEAWRNGQNRGGRRRSPCSAAPAPRRCGATTRQSPPVRGARR